MSDHCEVNPTQQKNIIMRMKMMKLEDSKGNTCIPGCDRHISGEYAQPQLCASRRGARP